MSNETEKKQERILLTKVIRKKDRKALGRLHSVYYSRIKRYIASRVDLIEDVEDLAQSVFFELCKVDSTYKECQNAEAYLLGIAKKLIAIYYRSQSRQVKIIPIESVDEIAADIQAVKKISQQGLRDIKNLIARLPPKTQEAISLRLIEGLSMKEAAKRTGCSIHTFCQRIYEAKRIIKKLKQGFNDRN